MNSNSMSLQSICHMQKIMDMVADDPQITPRMISSELKLDHDLVRDYIQQMTSDIRERDQESLMIMRDQYVREIEQDKMMCDHKLQGCMSPREGSRWIEEKRKLRDAQIRLLGLDAPSKQQIDIGVTVSKEHRDEIFQAAQMNIVNGEIVVPELEYEANEVNELDEIIEEV